MSDTAYGFVLGIFVIGVILGITLHTCCDNSVSNSALNNPKYKIDTIAKIHNGDTTYTYKFARK